MVGIRSRIILLSIAVSPLYSICFQTAAPQSKTRLMPIAVGEMAPDFTLDDQHGNKITLSEARGKNPVVLVFYRGYW